jgi:hypothetical protein
LKMTDGHITSSQVGFGVTAVGGVFATIVGIAAPAGSDLASNNLFLAAVALALLGAAWLIGTGAHAAYAHTVSKGRNQRRKSRRSEPTEPEAPPKPPTGIRDIAIVQTSDDAMGAIVLDGEDAFVENVHADVPHGAFGVWDRGRRNRITHTKVNVRDPKNNRGNH